MLPVNRETRAGIEPEDGLSATAILRLGKRKELMSTRGLCTTRYRPQRLCRLRRHLLHLALRRAAISGQSCRGHCKRRLVQRNMGEPCPGHLSHPLLHNGGVGRCRCPQATFPEVTGRQPLLSRRLASGACMARSRRCAGACLAHVVHQEPADVSRPGSRPC